ncbi:DNA-3-methyladenine glycosylase family protein [Mycoplasma sp. P36-A1]|uniref:DNA-3-methyladenine glycosylase family protein n=1 Tax=Mycoplasma sp. P36-A1 TaxID=3252900 RepID=UPI003C2C87A3
MIIDAYDINALNHFKSADPILYNAMIEIGPLTREGIDDGFKALVFQIISQQISTKAALTIKNRLLDTITDISPKSILELDKESLQKIGLTYRKCDYIFALALATQNNTINFELMSKMSNEEIIKVLLPLPGIGIWTVEMFLLFTLNRNDIISYNDLMIRVGMEKLYNYDKLDKKTFLKHQEIYGQYATIASIYLWHISKK